MASSAEVRRALVLGASSEIGVAVCSRYLDAGYHVVGHYWTDREALAPLTGSHGRFEAVQCDLGDLQAAQSLAGTVSPIDALVCLAALATPSTLETIDPDVLQRSVNVGALSAYVAMGILGPAMAERGWGRIVIGSSIGVRFGGGSDSFAYALAHHASEFIPRSARDWAAAGVLTNVVRIGVTDTALHSAFPGRSLAERSVKIPMRRPATVDEVADFLFWHGSEANSFVTGQLTAISGGE